MTLRVGVAPAEPPEVFNLRSRWPAEALAAQGLIELVELPEQLDVRETQGHKRPAVTHVHNLPEMDVLVLTRVLSERLVSLIPVVQHKGIKVVVDLDDNFRHLPPLSTQHAKIDPNLNVRHNWRHFAKAARLADWVTCSTPELQAFRPEASTVVRNCVPERYTRIAVPEEDVPLVGWSGALNSHPGDLSVTHGGVADAVMNTNARFRVVGDPSGVQQALGFQVPIRGTGMLPQVQYPVELARLHVGVVPLADNAFTRAKSWITPLTMTALGVWWVGSSGNSEYEALYHLLLGACGSPPAALARHRARDWRREVLRALRTPQDEREDAIAAGKRHVLAHHTIEGQAWRRLEVWQAVADS